MNLELLLKHASTDLQKQIVQAVIDHGGLRAAARALGLHAGTVAKALSRLRKKAARVDPSAHANGAPLGYSLRGVSTLLDSDGEVVQTWVKTKQDRDNWLEYVRETLSEITDTSAGRMTPLPPPEHTEDRLSVYPIADAHIGLLTWATQTGESFDLKIAENLYRDNFSELVATSPRTQEAVLAIVGDFAHVDGVMNTTTKGTPQDTDWRWPKLCKVVVRLIMFFIDVLLTHHGKVRVVLLAGNHDESVAVALAVAMAAMYLDDPRVIVHTDPSAIVVVRYGCCMLGFAHGHKTKPIDMPGLVAANYRIDWGETWARHVYTGHSHRDHLIEKDGCSVESLRSLTPDSAWMATWHYTLHDLKCDVWDREYGLRNRTVQPSRANALVRRAIDVGRGF